MRSGLMQPITDWMERVDRGVYGRGGFIAAHVWPWYQPHRASPLYDWPGLGSLKFTYTPFAAIVFISATVLPLRTLEYLSLAVNTVPALFAIWVTVNPVGCPGGHRAG